MVFTLYTNKHIRKAINVAKMSKIMATIKVAVLISVFIRTKLEIPLTIVIIAIKTTKDIANFSMSMKI